MAKALTVNPVLETRKTIQDLKSVGWKLNPDEAQKHINDLIAARERAIAEGKNIVQWAHRETRDVCVVIE
jgi:hypothetical protein